MHSAVETGAIGLLAAGDRPAHLQVPTTRNSIDDVPQMIEIVMVELQHA